MLAKVTRCVCVFVYCDVKYIAAGLISLSLSPSLLLDSSLTVKNFWKYHKELTKMFCRGSKFSEWFNITNVEFPNSLLYMNSASIAYTAERHILKLAKDFTNHHPAPSWKQAAYAMYMTGLYCIVGDIQMQYIDKGEKHSVITSLLHHQLAHTHVPVVSQARPVVAIIA